jgi:hypothetical protein
MGIIFTRKLRKNLYNLTSVCNPQFVVPQIGFQQFDIELKNIRHLRAGVVKQTLVWQSGLTE